MRETDLIWTCEECGKEFRVYCDDGAGDFVVCWNWCPHCGAKNNIWIRFVNHNNRYDTEILLGITSLQAIKMKAKK
jgi:hypothetical protein